MLITLVAFIVALGVLIAVHEYGHYRVAVACGVKVLRFSVGFGRTVFRYKPKKQKANQDTEFVIGAFPLGGYVKMLDEREGPVKPEERHLAFNAQPLKSRAAIVAAGPIANLLLAVLLYACVNWWGVDEPKAILSSPVAGSVAEQAGLAGGETVDSVSYPGEEPRTVRSFDELGWLLTKAAFVEKDVTLHLADGRAVALPLGGLHASGGDPVALAKKIGVFSPFTQARIAEVLPDGAAQKAGLQGGDKVLEIDGRKIADGSQLYETIRASGRSGSAATQSWTVERGGRVLDLRVTPAVVSAGGATFGRINAAVGSAPAMTRVQYGPIEGLTRAAGQTYEMSAFSLRMMGKMIVGEASYKNLSGPITIAEYAGKTASLGLVRYLTFLALISVSLGVLNLLPLPVLDGGHLMYYLWEAVTGRSISETWMERMQRGGVAVLLLMMSIALFNDVTRLFG